MLMLTSNVATKGKFFMDFFELNNILSLIVVVCVFSVVEFASLSDMKTAIEKLDDTELNGRRVRLVEDRRGSGRGGGGGKKINSIGRLNDIQSDSLIFL